VEKKKEQKTIKRLPYTGINALGYWFSFELSRILSLSMWGNFPFRTRGEGVCPPTGRALESLRPLGSPLEDKGEGPLILNRLGIADDAMMWGTWCSSSSSVKLAKEWVMLVVEVDGFRCII